MEIVINRLGGGRIYAGNGSEIRQRRALDRSQSSEVTQQRALASGAHAGNFLQAAARDVPLAPRAMGSHREAMGFVA